MEIPVHIRGLPTWAALALSQFPMLPCCLGFPRGKKEACLSSQVIKSGLEHDLTGIQPAENCFPEVKLYNQSPGSAVPFLCLLKERG